MKLDNFKKELNSKQIAENIEKLFDVSVDLTKYSREQLEDVRNKIRTRVFQYEGSSKINELLANEAYQKDKAMLELLNTRIKEMLGEQMKQLIGKMDQLSEAKKSKPDFLDLDKDGNKKEPMKKAAKDAKVKEAAKPDFLDLDGDGNKKEPMKKAAQDKKMKEEKVDEKAVSKSQQQAAGVALAAKKAGKTPPGKGAAAQMAKMPKKELEKFAGTKHKGLPKHKKADESVGDEELDEFFFFKSNEKPNHDPLAKRKPGDVKKAGAAGYKDVVKNPKNPLSIKGKRPDLPQQENKELLPRQKKVAKDILDKDMAAAKADRAAKKQAGTKIPTHKQLKRRADKMFGPNPEAQESFRKHVKTVNESLEYLLREDEEGKAKTITAASDMVNDFTSWMQRVGQYQTKSMIELADAIRADFGQQEAETFKQSVAPALATTLEILTQQREVLSQAVAVLAGEAAPAVPMGAEPMPAGPEEPGIDTAAPDEMNAGDELDAFAASDAAAGAGTTGREVREGAEQRKARLIAEQHSIIARLAK